MHRGVCIAWGLLLLLDWPLALAGEDAAAAAQGRALSPDHLFGRGHYEAAFTSGVFFSPFVATQNRPTIDYSFTGLQLGYMLSDVKGSGWWRGNFELAGEGFGSAVFEGPGGYIAGGTLWLRYNFLPRIAPRFVPYVQAGAGILSTDIDHGIVGQPFNFNLDLGVGARYFIARNWALSLEYRYQHISNANLGRNNVGINACGPVLGISCFF
jgi:lipid A 3-O-deacylase